MSVVIVSATRHPEETFWSQTALGMSLTRLSFDPRLAARVAFSNQSGLATVYNRGMEACKADDAVCFIHDDVWIDDYWFLHRVLEGLASYDIIGVAGNKRRRARQPSWAFADPSFQWDDRNFLSGAIARGKYPFGPVVFFGEGPAECELLDGVFLGARVALLRKHGLCFDERYTFHFYDMDFCRKARSLGLRLGTWPVSLTHQSGGSFESQAWREGYQRYLEKWGD